MTTIRSAAGNLVRTREVGWWAMVMLLATETALFVALISSYFFVRWQTDGGWPPGGLPDPDLTRPTWLTAALVATSLPMVLAGRAARAGNQATLRLALFLVFTGMAAFVGLQVWDFAERTELYTPQTDAHGSLDFALTGIHGAHVALGVLGLLWVQWRAWAGAYGRKRDLGVRVTAMYVHFVNVLAVVIYLTVYITPYW
jgi:cytochrome c oxidase subunit III